MFSPSKVFIILLCAGQKVFSGNESVPNPSWLVMVTNQDGLGTDSFPENTFWPAHNKMMKTLEGENIYFSKVHIDRSFEHENKPTRKPSTGMLTEYLTGDYD